MKQTKILLTVITILAIAWLFNSCTKDESIEEMEIASQQQNQNTKSKDPFLITKDENSKKPYTVLGKKRKNPFTIANINQALANLYGTAIAAKNSTHRYIKFTPSSQEHLAYLEDWETKEEIPLFDFPMEYKVESSGEHYIDPAVSDSLYTYQYASVKNDMELPDVPYEVIDELYLDKSNPLLLVESFKITDNADEILSYVMNNKGMKYDDLNDEVLAYDNIPPIINCPEGYHPELTVEILTDPIEWNLVWVCVKDPEPEETSLNDCGCSIPANPRNPAGCIRVDNDGVMDPVQIASIKVKDTWFSGDVTNTDANGCWRVNKNYSGRVWMWVEFVNKNVEVRDRRQWLGIRAVRDYVGRFTSPPYNNIQVDYDNGADDNTSNERMYWAAAHSLNTVNDYRTRAAADGIPLPRTGLNWNNRHGDGAASAAMLQGVEFSLWINFFEATGGGLPLPLYASDYLLPDITNQYGIGESAADFTGTGYHELGHASHHGLVGEEYWVPYRTHIVAHEGYGTFPFFIEASRPGHVALGEAIGNFTGAWYGTTNDGGENGVWDNADNFIPMGLMWDLMDDTPNDIVTDPNNAAITGFDNISGFTPNMIFNGLTSHVNRINSIRKYRNRLRVLHLSDTPNTAAAYNNFVDIYDVFN